MKLTLMIEGSAATIAAVLQSLPSDAGTGTAIENVMVMTGDGEKAAHNLQPGDTVMSAGQQRGAVGNGDTTTGAASQPAATAPMPGASSPAPAHQTGDDTQGAAEPSNGAASDDVDATGLPWDERIHSSTKGVNEDGSWKKRRGGPKGAELAAIEAELRGAAPADPTPPAAQSDQPTHSDTQPAAVAPTPAPSAVPPMPAAAPTASGPVAATPASNPVPMPTAMPMQPTGMTVTPAAPMPTAQPVQQQAQPMPMPTPAPAPVEQQPAAAPAMGFTEFMGQLGPKMAGDNPSITTEYVTRISAEMGINSLTDMATDPARIGQAIGLMQRDGVW